MRSLRRVEKRHRFGNSGLRILRGPGVRNLDLSVLRNFVVRERLRIQLRAEAFNLTNTPAFGIPGSNVSNLQLSGGVIRSLNGFTEITSADPTERQLRFALRFAF